MFPLFGLRSTTWAVSVGPSASETMRAEYKIGPGIAIQLDRGNEDGLWGGETTNLWSIGEKRFGLWEELR